MVAEDLQAGKANLFPKYVFIPFIFFLLSFAFIFEIFFPRP